MFFLNGKSVQSVCNGILRSELLYWNSDSIGDDCDEDRPERSIRGER